MPRSMPSCLQRLTRAPHLGVITIGLCVVAISAFLAFCGDDESAYARRVGEVMRALESHRGSLRVQGLLVKGSLCQQGHAPECEVRFALRDREVNGGPPSLPVRYAGCSLPDLLLRHAELAPDVTVEGRLYDSPERGEHPEKAWFRTTTDAPPRLNPERAYLEAERVLVKTGGPYQMRRRLRPDGGHGAWVPLPTEPPPPAPPPCR